MIKIMGCIFLMASSCLVGYMKASTYKERCQELESIIEIIKLLEIEITYRKEALAKAFYKVSKVRDCWFSTVLQECSNSLERRFSLEDSWKSAAGRYNAATPLESGDMDIIADLLQGLGKSDSEGQKKIIEPVLIRLQSALQAAYIREHKMGKMYKALGAAAGMIIVILII